MDPRAPSECSPTTRAVIVRSSPISVPAISSYAALAKLYRSTCQKIHNGLEAALPSLVGNLPKFVMDLFGFDPTNGICPTEAYVRVAVGLDYLGAAPVRGSIYGGTGEKLEFRVSIASDSSGGR